MTILEESPSGRPVIRPDAQSDDWANQNMHYVYILFLENGYLYKGSTDNLTRRINQHKCGKVKSTKNKNPKLIHYEGYLLESDAKRREKFLKTTEGRRLLKQQLKDVLNSNLGRIA